MKPHSKGLIFSRSIFVGLDKSTPREVNKTLNTKENLNTIINFNKDILTVRNNFIIILMFETSWFI